MTWNDSLPVTELLFAFHIQEAARWQLARDTQNRSAVLPEG